MEGKRAPVTPVHAVVPHCQVARPTVWGDLREDERLWGPLRILNTGSGRIGISPTWKSGNPQSVDLAWGLLSLDWVELPLTRLEHKWDQ